MLKKFCQCAGLASLILLMNYVDLLGDGHNVRYHSPFPLAGICWAQIADILLVGLGLFAVLAPLSRTRFYPVAQLLLAIVIPPYILYHEGLLYPFTLPAWLLPTIAVAWAVLLLLLRQRMQRGYAGVIRFASAMGVGFGFFALCSILQLLWVARWHPEPQQHSAAWATTAQPPRSHPVLVWIVFDELSYDQVFEHRSSTLALPNFDALRSQSTLYTNIQPSGNRTVRVLPSLLEGKLVDDWRFDMQNRFSVHYAGEPGWQMLNGSDSVFGDAEKNGWRTAATGWYNPYCTTYGSAIEDCYWNNLDTLQGPMVQSDTFLRNTIAPLAYIARRRRSERDAGEMLCDEEVQQHYQSHVEIEQHALQILHTDQADFVFLHFGVPHSPNLWDRHTAQYTQTCGSSYIDSLALADRMLGNILGILQSSPRWSDTTLIVQGDHSWRIGLWRWSPTWTAEDTAASHDVFDPRPALIVHEAGQTQPSTDASALPLLYVHSVVEKVLHGENRMSADALPAESH